MVRSPKRSGTDGAKIAIASFFLSRLVLAIIVPDRHCCDMLNNNELIQYVKERTAASAITEGSY